MEACSNGQAALRRERCPSQSLQRAVLQLLQRAEELGASSRAQEVTAEGLRELREQAAPLLRSLTSALQRFDTEASARGSVCKSASPLPSADLYTEVLRAVRWLVQGPALAAALEGEAPRGGRPSTVLTLLLETLLSQMLSSGVRCTATDPIALVEDHCWPTVTALLEAVPVAGAAALLRLADPRGSSMLVSWRMHDGEHPRALQAEMNVLVGRALEALAGQAPFVLCGPDAAKLAPELNERVGQHSAPGRSEEWRALWAPVRHGIEALLFALVAAGDRRLYNAFKAALPLYTPGKHRPPLLSLMSRQYTQLQEEELEPRLRRILLACGLKDSERMGLIQLHDFLVEHYAWTALLIQQTQDTAWAVMARGYVAAAQAPGVRTALMEGPAGKVSTAAPCSKPKAARALDVSASQPLAPHNSSAATALPRPAAAVCKEPPVARVLDLAAEAPAPARTPRGIMRMARTFVSRLPRPGGSSAH